VVRIVLAYAAFASLWILLSDRAVAYLFRDPESMIAVHSIKGMVFVLVTSLLLLATLGRLVRGLAERETKFSRIFQMSPDAIDLTHLDTGVLVDCNQSCERLYGYSREELIGHSTLPGDLGTWVDAQDRARHVAELKAHGIALGFETPARRKDGSTFIAMVSSAVLEIDGQRCNLSLERDITLQKRAEEALRESTRRLELAAEAGRLGIWDRNLVDGSGIWNGRMFEIYGLEPRSEPPDFPSWCRETLHPEDRARVEAALRAAAEGPDGGLDLEFRAVRPAGSVRYIRSSCLVLRNAEGRAVRIIGVNYDRTREVEAEAEQRRLQAELQHAEKLESLGSLAGGVAHDMNNVLAAIMGMASALQAAGSDGEAPAKALDTIIRACSRGRDVVKGLLYFARKDLEAAGPVNLNAIAQEVIQLLSYTTLSRVKVSTDFQEPLPPVEGDGGALTHALINLCVNAVDAMPDGGALHLQTRRTGDSVTVSIKDTGYGMSPEVARKAVEPFFTTKPVGKGTGLGLAMVYGTVKAHRGTLEIKSEPNQGTEITLTFPALLRHLSAPVVRPEAGPAKAPLRILLVDDDELIRTSVEPMLTSLGHQVHSVEGGQEALDRLRAGLEVDLVILDMNMPGLNGAQTLSRLLALRPGQKVLMASGYSDDSIAPLLEARPGVFSLRKPFSLKELRTKLENLR
jgi:PAS domain S-box-containing protein